MSGMENWIFREFSKGAVIFSAGDLADMAYVVRKGTVDIRSRRNGSDELVETLSQGDFFGEMALVDNLPRSATAVAAEDVTLAVFTKEEIEESLNKSDLLTYALVKLLTKRLRKATEGDIT